MGQITVEQIAIVISVLSLLITAIAQKGNARKTHIEMLKDQLDIVQKRFDECEDERIYLRGRLEELHAKVAASLS